MTLQAGDKLMLLADVSEMLGIPVHTLYRWRYKGAAQSATGWAVTCGTVERPSRPGSNSRSTNAIKQTQESVQPRIEPLMAAISSTSGRSGRALLAGPRDVSGRSGG